MLGPKRRRVLFALCRTDEATVYINVDEDVRFSRELNRSAPATREPTTLFFRLSSLGLSSSLSLRSCPTASVSLSLVSAVS